MTQAVAPTLSTGEQARTADLLRLFPLGYSSVLDIGARDGRFARLLAQCCPRVVALDLIRPAWTIDGVETVAGDARKLDFPDGSFDIVFCAEVLEHIPGVERAAREIARVAKCAALIGVPFEQDIRVGRATCEQCGRLTPAWGHVNSFTERRLKSLFPTMKAHQRSFVQGPGWGRTTALGAWLMNLGGNPWHPEGAEGCVHCGAILTRPTNRARPQRLCSSVALAINRLQERVTPGRPTWLHVLFVKK